MPSTINDGFMDEQKKWAEGYPYVGGMMHVVPVKLLTHMEIYRFATAGSPQDDLYREAWWIGVSAYSGLEALAPNASSRLRQEARARLAVVSERNEMNLLVHARVRQPLSAWCGTPRAARIYSSDRHYVGNAMGPDRSFTQLYIPGLCSKLTFYNQDNHKYESRTVQCIPDWRKALEQASIPKPL